MADQDPSLKTQDSNPLEMIAEGKHSIESVCRASKMSILELADHVCTPRNIEALERVAQLHATQREILLGSLKRQALTRLGELTDEVGAMNANEVRACEVMRRACADLLRNGGSNTEKRSSRPGGPGGPKARGYHPEPLTPAFEAEVLEALERLGEEREVSNKRTSPVYFAGNVSGVPWSKAEPQATSGGDVVEEVGVTHDVQVGMAFGKTSDHGTGTSSGLSTKSTHTETLNCGCHGQVPPARADCGVGNLPLSPHGQAPKTPHAHATHNQLHHPRPPPRASPPGQPPL